MEPPSLRQDALETYKSVRKRFYEEADAVFGPGFFSMSEYYFMKKMGSSPFAMLFSEPRVVYDEWTRIFKEEDRVKTLFRNVAGPGYSSLLADIQRNDGIRVWNFFHNLTRGFQIAA
jgi:hypothetical protein